MISIYAVIVIFYWMMNSVIVLLAVMASAGASGHPADQLKEFMRAKILGDSKEHKEHYAAFGGMRLEDPRIVKSSRTLASSNDAVNYYYYLDGSAVLFFSYPLNVCICGTTFNGIELCEVRTAISSADGSVTSTVDEYSSGLQCDGAITDSTTTTITYPLESSASFSCDEGADEVVFEVYGRVESKTAYESLGQGMVETQYATLSDCEDSFPLETMFRILFKCGYGAYNVFPTNCPNTFTESFSDSSTQVTTVYGELSSCATVDGVQTRKLIAQCANSDDDDHDDDGDDHDDHLDDMDDDEIRGQYMHWFGQGFSSSDSSSSDVTLSEGEYYGLISAVSIAILLVAILVCALLYSSCLKKSALGGSDKSSSLL